ncbi:MAG: hypothetical protein KKF56_01690 [Nanoarchaeota archaeon]|nr:hypothetical protein [Nanoarchaeota archaeon]
MENNGPLWACDREARAVVSERYAALNAGLSEAREIVSGQIALDEKRANFFKSMGCMLPEELEKRLDPMKKVMDGVNQATWEAAKMWWEDYRAEVSKLRAG